MDCLRPSSPGPAVRRKSRGAPRPVVRYVRPNITIGEEVAAGMARRVGEPVDVRVVGDLDCAPKSFLWRGRLYVVREVLGHWRDRREWWAAAAARALHGDDWDQSQSAQVGLDEEREVWRVEASAGRTFSSGVYDLSREPAAGPPVATEVWHLLQVAD